MSLQQKFDEDRQKDTRGAMKSAADRVSRDTSKVRELQAVGRMILDYCGEKRGLDQAANLKVLVGVKPNSDTNLTNLAASIRDAGMAVIRSYIEKTQLTEGYLSDEAADEYVQDRKVCPLLRNALSIGADEGQLARVRAAIKKLEGN